MDIYKLINTIPTDWKRIIANYPNLKNIENFLNREKMLFGDNLPTYPSLENIFRCFHYRNASNTKVVILGQDPYHGPGQATGLCFAVDNDIKPPPSLKNIMKEIKNDCDGDLNDITLEKWAKQGVLLMNTALTVRKKKPTSHMKIWLPFTKYIINYLNKKCNGIVFIAWGAFAYDKLIDIDTSKHRLLVSSHPSPLSANRVFGSAPAFIGSCPFSKTNEYLDKIRKSEIKVRWRSNSFNS